MIDFIKIICTLAEVNATSFIQQAVVYSLYKNGRMSLSEIQAQCASITIYRATMDMLIAKGIVEKIKLQSPTPTVKFNLSAEVVEKLNKKLQNGINTATKSPGIHK